MVLPEAVKPRLKSILFDQGVEVAYLISPLPRGLVSASRGGLGLVFGPSIAASDRYDRCQRLRFSLMGILPAGNTEMIALNDARLSIAAAVIETGDVVYSHDDGLRQHFETMTASQALDFGATVLRFLGDTP